MSSSVDFAQLQASHMMQCWSSQQGYAPIAVDHVEGCWIHTSDGRKIFDLRSAHECINLGFNHPKVIAALKSQLDRVAYVTDDFATEPTGLLARKLAALTPGSPNKRVYFAQSGAAAVEAAIKGARLHQYNRMFHDRGLHQADAPSQYPYPYKIISRYKSWHGATSGAASVSGDPRRWFQEPLTVPGVVFAPEANAYRPPFGSGDSMVDENLRYLEYIIENEGGSNKVAAVLVEPVVGSNGIIPAPPRYLEGVRRLCDQWGLLMIVDETMTGMGRTGRLFAIEHSGVEPDILIMGKALGAYCPLTATVFSEKVSRSFDDHLFGHGQSYSGHALGCAGALAALEVLLEDGVLEAVDEKGSYLEERLQNLAAKHPCVGDVRGLGLFYTMELVADPQTRQPLRKSTEKYSPTVIAEVSRFLFEERNIYVPSDKFGVWVVPPLVVTHSEIDWITEAIDEALLRVDQQLGL
ncbi:MAG: aspartate aminotransferase family protein [Magnetovibrio sp.]|nr:aspartate aminotransferase family protein [Magnetovibrio sp.]